MYIKFIKSLNDYKYIVMFDLASWTSGVCLWNITDHKPEKTTILKVDKHAELPAQDLYNQINNYFTELSEFIDLKDVLVFKEAMPIQAGRFTTIQTLIALARSHAILDLYLSQNNIDSYDSVGIYPATTRAYFKKVHPLEEGQHEEKEDINKYVVEKYSLTSKTLDESDAIFLTETFVDSKWNKDIDEEIKQIKRHKKTLKADHAITACDNKIAFLLSLKH